MRNRFDYSEEGNEKRGNEKRRSIDGHWGLFCPFIKMKSQMGDLTKSLL